MIKRPETMPPLEPRKGSSGWCGKPKIDKIRQE
jgi:hypothetical protein